MSDADGTTRSTYPPADIKPAEFERWVAELYEAVAYNVEDLRVKHEPAFGPVFSCPAIPRRPSPPRHCDESATSAWSSRLVWIAYLRYLRC